MRPARRICSLLPSATEIVCALGLEDRLVGVTHECDYSPSVRALPQVTSSAIDGAGTSSRQIDQAVRSSLESQATIYHLDAELLAELKPDLILTQELCTVCAVGTHEVQHALQGVAGGPQVVSLEPRTIGEVLDTILLVGRLTGEVRRAVELMGELQARLQAVQQAVADRPIVSVLTLEWLDPPFVGGHWVPEMVALAGGRDVLGLPAEPSRQVTWEDVAATSAEVVIAMPCGFDLARTQEELTAGGLPAAVMGLPAGRKGRIYAVDGSAYFSRPGPRLVEGVEILACILQGEAWNSAPPDSWAPQPAASTAAPVLP